jgi:hypothetical protein
MESRLFGSVDPDLDPDWIGPGSGLDSDLGSEGGPQIIFIKNDKTPVEKLDILSEDFTVFSKSGPGSPGSLHLGPDLMHPEPSKDSYNKD